MKKNFTFLFLLLIFGTSAISKEPYPFKEKDYQKAWCDRHNGVMEHVLPDQARVD